MTDEEQQQNGADAPAEEREPGDARSPLGPVTRISGKPRAEGPRPTPLFAGSDDDFAPAGEQDQAGDSGSFTQFMRRSSTAVEDAPEPQGVSPRQPRTLLDVGLSKPFMTDLALKIIHYSGSPTLSQLIRRLGLSGGVVQQLIGVLMEEHLVEVMSQSDLYTGNYRYRLSERGNVRAQEALDRSRYAGPAPVTAEQYSETMRRLRAHKQEFSRSRIKSALADLVLAADIVDSSSRALYSGKATLFYGASGNGKTSILERYVHDLDGFSLVPYAIYAYGQTIRVFDQSIHEPLEDLDLDTGLKEDRVDRRWVMVRRPAIVLGAELGVESLEMAHDPVSRFYQAPPHIKAQGGVLVIDDFGRQKASARDVLTRLLIPLERGWDTLNLVTGEKVTIPFSMQMLFGTNIPVRQLADDSLLRRILYKVEIPRPQAQEFTEILRRLCLQKKVRVAEGAIDYVVEKLYGETRVKPRASYGRDLLEMVLESASFDGREPVLDQASFDTVFRMFVSQESEDEGLLAG
jgi:predicted ATPase with chaperone activity